MRNLTIPEELNLLIDRYNGDEITEAERPEAEARMLELAESRDALLEALLVRHGELTAEIEGDKFLVAKYTERKQRHERSQQRLEAFADNLLRRSKLAEFKCDLGKINYRKSSAVVLDKEFVVLDEWARVVPEKREADKMKIKELIVAGKKIPGAHVEERMNIQFK